MCEESWVVDSYVEGTPKLAKEILELAAKDLILNKNPENKFTALEFILRKTPQYIKDDIREFDCCCELLRIEPSTLRKFLLRAIDSPDKKRIILFLSSVLRRENKLDLYEFPLEKKVELIRRKKNNLGEGEKDEVQGIGSVCGTEGREEGRGQHCSDQRDLADCSQEIGSIAA